MDQNGRLLKKTMSLSFQRNCGIRSERLKNLSTEENVTKKESFVLCRDQFSAMDTVGKFVKQAQVAVDISADTTTALEKIIAPHITSIVN